VDSIWKVLDGTKNAVLVEVLNELEKLIGQSNKASKETQLGMIAWEK
jgi:hypothetical protein